MKEWLLNLLLYLREENRIENEGYYAVGYDDALDRVEEEVEGWDGSTS